MGYPNLSIHSIKLVFDLIMWRPGRGLSLLEDGEYLDVQCEYRGILGCLKK